MIYNGPKINQQKQIYSNGFTGEFSYLFDTLILDTDRQTDTHKDHNAYHMSFNTSSASHTHEISDNSLNHVVYNIKYNPLTL